MWDVLAQSCYSPIDLNYPDWHNWVKNKAEIYRNAKEISTEVAEFRNKKIIEWNSIDDGMDKLLNFLEV